MELLSGRIELNEKETDAVESLLENNQGSVSFTRRDPGETGPVIVYIDNESWEVDNDGVIGKQEVN